MMKRFALLMLGAFLFTACSDDEPTIEEIFCSEAVSCDQSYMKKNDKSVTDKALAERKKASTKKCVDKMNALREEYTNPNCDYYYDMYLQCKIDKTRKKTPQGEKYLKLGCAVMYETNDVSEEFCKSEKEAIEQCLEDNGGKKFHKIVPDELSFGVTWKE